MKGRWLIQREMPMLDELQINTRRPLWIALSELWLDTELDAGDLERIAHVMADSALTIEELRHVYLVEVAPVVSPNLLSPAGEWAGFDEEWLCSSIIENLRQRFWFTRFWSRCMPTRAIMTYATERHWTKLVELVEIYSHKNLAA
ncbi:MAG: hypothetical protein ABI876_11545 [Bacteroidota bacterium]